MVTATRASAATILTSGGSVSFESARPAVRARARIASAVPSQRARTLGTFTALVMALGTLAYLHDGTKVADVELNDGGVWVTHLDLDGHAVTGHLNYLAREVDSWSEPRAVGGFDISQEANAVVVHTLQPQPTIAPIDTASWTPGSPSELPPAADATQGSDVVAIVDPDSGRVWAVPAGEADSFSAESSPPVLDDVRGAHAVVGKDDVIHVVTPDGAVQRVFRQDGAWVATEDGEVPEFGADDDLQLAAVGGTAVVYDVDAAWVAWGGHRVDLADVEGLGSSSKLTLQQTGDDVGAIALSGPSGLIQLPLDGGEPASHATSAGGNAIAPVTVGECTYAAWSGSGAYRRDCPDPDDDEELTVPRLQQPNGESAWSFRTSRDLVVLNDASDGTIILVNENMEVLDDPWLNVRDEIEDDKDKSDQETVETKHRRNENPPKPEDDAFGVRAGTSVTLPVLANDVDPDGDVLTVQLPQARNKLGTVELVRDGRAVRLTIDDPEVSGTADFEYLADDGERTAPAVVHLDVHPTTENSGPRLLAEELRRPQLTIKERGSGTYYVLQDYIDQDGDALWISNVDSPPGLTTVWEPDGQVIVTDEGRQEDGRERTVRVMLTDGSLTGTETVDLKVTVLALREANEPPVANADFASVLAGDSVAIQPLKNDSDPDSVDLYPTMTKVPPELEVLDLGNDTYSLDVPKNTESGAYYVEYEVSDGYASARSVIRVDVLDRRQADPIPDNDLAVVPRGGETLVPVLANDTNPLGGLLVLASVDTRGGRGDQGTRGVVAEVVGHEFLRIRDNGISGPTTITYDVSNGQNFATGTVTVVVPPDPDLKRSGPVAGDDDAVVRSGDVASIDVLANDADPTDQPLRIRPDLEITVGDDLGQAFVSEDRVRFVATGESGEVRIQYAVEDPDGNVDVAKVRLNVQPPGPNPNTRPIPDTLSGRMFQGGTAEILVPLDSVDPDGDSVTLVGIEDAPRKGQVRIGTDVLTYTASESQLGDDSFTYLVEDEYGATGVGQVQIGIAQTPASNEPPVAVADDRLRVRPNRILTIPVTANDNDPEGGALTLRGIDATGTTDTDAEIIEDGRIQLSTPGESSTLTYRYTVEDDLGAPAEGVVEVRVSASAPALPPIARDDRVPLAQVIGRDEVTVEVLGNDEDPDGAVTSITPETEASDVIVTDTGELVVPVAGRRRVIPYSLTDPDGEVGRAVVIVPGSDTDAARRPVLRDDADVQIIDAGTTAQIDLRDLVLVREGRQPLVQFDESIQAGPGHDGSALKADDDSVITFGAADDFFGPTAVTAVVSDGGPDSVDVLSSTITIPIYVNAAGNTEPTLRVPVIEAAPNEPWRGDLAPLATDPDPGDQQKLRFEASDPDAGLNADVVGDELVVEVVGDVGDDDVLRFTLEVTDGSHTVRREAKVDVVTSTRPLLQLRQDARYEVDAGDSIDIQLADLVIDNPYPDDPVHLAGPPAGAGDDATIDPSDEGFTVTPDSDFDGTLNVTYVVRDGSRQQERDVQGTVQVVVAAPPDAPTSVTAEAVDATTVEVNWLAGDSNGAAITGYEVIVEGSDPYRVDGPQTSATVPGLTPGQDYRFQVIATNEVGDSEPSEWSRSVTPDEVPVAPTDVKVKYGDERFVVSWKQPAYQGTDIRQYKVQIGDTIYTSPGDGLEFPIDGLTNGKDYAVKVRGYNDHDESPNGEPGASPWSGVVHQHPNGAPIITNVEIHPDPPTDDTPSATLRFEVDDQGEPIDRPFRVKRTDGVITTCQSTTECRVVLRENKDEKFAVQGHNRVTLDAEDGWGEFSEQTDAVRGAGQPDPVPNFDPAPTSRSGEARFTFSYPYAKGHGAPDVTFDISPGTVTGGPVSGYGDHTVTLTGLPDGTDSTISVTATTTVNGQDSNSSGPGTGSVNTFAPCAVDVWAGDPGYRSHTFNYSVTSNGRPCSWTGSDGGSPSDRIDRGSTGTRQHKVDDGPVGGTITLTVTATTERISGDPRVDPVDATDTGGTWSPAITGTDEGAAPNGTGNCLEYCRYFGARLSGFEPGSSGYCPITHVGRWRNGETWWYRAGPAGSDGAWSGRLHSPSGHPLAWNADIYGADPPYAGNCVTSYPSGNVDPS